MGLAPPLLDGELVDHVGAEPDADGGAHGPVQEVHDEGVLAHQPDEGLLGQVLVAEVGVEGPRVVIAVDPWPQTTFQTPV